MHYNTNLLIEVVRHEIGSELALGVSFSGDELTPGGNTIEDGKEIAKKLEATGIGNLSEGMKAFI